MSTSDFYLCFNSVINSAFIILKFSFILVFISSENVYLASLFQALGG